MSAWGQSWGQAWSDAWGPLGPEVVHALGDVTLNLSGNLAVSAIVFPQHGEDEVGPGGPDDETLDPRARKWLRERYKKEQPQAVRGTVGVHAPELDGATPSPATNAEPVPVIDVAPLEEDLAAAAKEAIAAVTKAREQRDDDNRRRAMALVLALLDD